MTVEDAIKVLVKGLRVQKVTKGSFAIPAAKRQNTVTVEVNLGFKPNVVFIWNNCPNLLEGVSASAIITQDFPYVPSTYHSSFRITEDGFSVSGWNYDYNTSASTGYYTALLIDNLTL